MHILADSGKHFDQLGVNPESFMLPQQLITTPVMAAAAISSMPGSTSQNSQINSGQYTHGSKKKSSISALGHYEKNLAGFPSNSNSRASSSKLILEPLHHSSNQRAFAEDEQHAPSLAHHPSSLIIARNQS